MRNGEDFGIAINGFTVTWPSGRFIAPRTLEATLADGTKRLLRGRNVIIGTGTHGAVDNTPGLREAEPLSHVEALELDVVPEHLIVLGGRYVGLEFAQAIRRLGSEVTVVDRIADTSR